MTNNNYPQIESLIQTPILSHKLQKKIVKIVELNLGIRYVELLRKVQLCERGVFLSPKKT